MLTQTVAQICFDFFSRLPILVEAHDLQVSSDTGILPIRQFDDQIGFTERFIACLNDPRDPDLTDHGLDEMVRQRLYGILAGYEDCNDHDTLRGDSVMIDVGAAHGFVPKTTLRVPDENAEVRIDQLGLFESDVSVILSGGGNEPAPAPPSPPVIVAPPPAVTSRLLVRVAVNDSSLRPAAEQVARRLQGEPFLQGPADLLLPRTPVAATIANVIDGRMRGRRRTAQFPSE